jgi:glycolate oxidase FAD binding subunit
VGASLGTSAAGSATAFRLEGFQPSVVFRLARLREQLGSEGSLIILDREPSLAFWRAVRDVAPFVDDVARIVWRLSVPPAQGAIVLERIERAIPGAQGILDWGGGLIWLQLPAVANKPHGGTSHAGADVDTAHVDTVRSAIGDTGGHATLIRAPAGVRASVEVFHPQAAALASLSRRVKAQFDPSRVLNPARMYAGV